MSFWNSRQVKKTKKEHKCIYCGCKIETGSSCWHETGTYCGDFNDYRLCDRCHHLLKKYRKTFSPDDEIGELFEDLSSAGILSCPKCDADRYRDYEYFQNMQIVKIECDNCDHEYSVDLSIEGIDKFMER